MPPLPRKKPSISQCCKLSMLIVLLFCFVYWVSSAGKFSETDMQILQNSELLHDVGIKWLENFQNQPWTTRTQVGVGDVGQGFASMFQHSALKFGECVAINRGVELVGHYKEYTKNDMCKRVLSNRFIGQDCFFQHIHNGTHFFDPFGKYHQLHPHYTLATVVPVPKGLPVDMTPGRWWGILQIYMFRLNKRTSDRFTEISMGLGMSRGHKPDIGVHIRLGDKLTDIGSKQGKFSEMSVEKIVSIYLQEVENAISHLRSHYCPVTTIGTPIPYSAKSPADCAQQISVYVATDSTEAVGFVRQWASSNNLSQGSKIVVYMRSDTISQIHSGRNTSLGATLHDIRDAYSAAEEIIYDIHMLSQCQVLIGLIMSQVARMAASMSYATGTLQYALAVDSDNVHMFSRVDPQWRVSRVDITQA